MQTPMNSTMLGCRMDARMSTCRVGTSSQHSRHRPLECEKQRALLSVILMARSHSPTNGPQATA